MPSNTQVRDKYWRGRKLTPKQGKACELGGVARVAFERIRKHVVHKENISALTEAPKHWVLRNSVHRSSGWGFGADGKERRVCHAHTTAGMADVLLNIYCDNSVREKDGRCRKRETQAI